MSGMIVRVIPFIPYDFSGLGDGQSTLVILAMHIDVSVFDEVDLMVRARSGSIATGNILIGVQADGYTFDDPATIYTPPNGPSSSDPGTAYFTSASSFRSYTVSSLGQNIGAATAPMARLVFVALAATQVTGGSDLQITLSVDLNLKGGNPRALPMMPNGYRGYRIM